MEQEEVCGGAHYLLRRRRRQCLPIGNFLGRLRPARGFSLLLELTSRAVNSGISLKGWQELYENSKTQRKADIADAAERRNKEFEELHTTIASHVRKIAELECQIATTQAVEKPPAEDRPLLTRERENLQVLAFLGAARAYGYDPVTRNTAAKLIEQDLAKLHARLTDDRIRQHLKAGWELVPGDWRSRLSLKPNSDTA